VKERKSCRSAYEGDRSAGTGGGLSPSERLRPGSRRPTPSFADSPVFPSSEEQSVIDNLFNDFLAEYVCALCAWGLIFSTPHTHRPRRHLAASSWETTAVLQRGAAPVSGLLNRSVSCR
jgi:hypothetical protein